MKGYLLAAAAVLGVTIGAANSGCSSEASRSNEIPARKLRMDPRLAEGQRTFMQYCNQCHVGGGGGVGPSLNDKWMPSFFIHFKVRHGVGNMPHYSEQVVSDPQLDDVVRYIGYLKEHPREL
jgi:mono/diheme cytochrome c family protein